MLDLETIRRMIAERVPFVRALDVRIEQVEATRAVASMPFAVERTNHIGTVHAAAQFGLAETVSGVLALAAFADLQQAGYLPVVASASITYRRPAAGDLRAEATLSADEQARVRAEIASEGKARYNAQVTITNADGEVVTEMLVDGALIIPRERKG
ncbi:MAG TPA: YiiD C-terminal domain-containing protein [Ktedonobacterales bacterium]|nr:YiiD C-terminal domain-containing protein [Ktedonobacterales bacterium]